MSRAEVRHAIERTRPVWRWPLALAASMLFGLTAALLGDGVWDAVSWLALGGPLFFAWLAWRHRRS